LTERIAPLFEKLILHDTLVLRHLALAEPLSGDFYDVTRSGVETGDTVVESEP